MNKIILAMLLGMFLIPMALASDPAFVFKQNQQANITLQVLNNNNSEATASTSCYLTIKDKDFVMRKDHAQMFFINNGYFTLEVTGSIDKIGQYSATLNCNDGVNNLASNFVFEVTPSGFTGTLGFSFLIILICGAIVALGFIVKDGWFVVFGGLGLIGFGIYSFINGIAGFKDNLVTQGTSLFFVGIGAYLAIRAALEIINENS